MQSSLDKQNFINELWESELKGGIVISEYSAFLARDAEAALISGAYIATVMVCCAAIESHLRFDGGQGHSLSELSRSFGLSEDLARDIDVVRRFRNQWVHVKKPEIDDELQSNPDAVTELCQDMAMLSYKCLVGALCSNQFV